MRIHLLAASLDNLEQLTFQLQDLKVWLTSVEKSLKKTLETGASHPENLPAMQTQISRVGHELLSRQTDLASVVSSAQNFLSCLEKYNSAKVIFLLGFSSVLFLNCVILFPLMSISYTIGFTNLLS